MKVSLVPGVATETTICAFQAGDFFDAPPPALCANLPAR
jgi:hypothetical protein